MTNYFNQFTFEQVSYFTLLLSLVFGAIAVAVSIGLIVHSSGTHKIFKRVNAHISTRTGFRSLSVFRSTSELATKYKYWLSGFIIAGAAYSLFGLTRLDDAKIVAKLGLEFPLPFQMWIIESARLTLITLGTFSLVIGVMLGFFPNVFAAIEKRLSKWYSPRVIIHDLERMHPGFDNLIAKFPQIAGWIILFPALAVMINSGYKVL